MLFYIPNWKGDIEINNNKACISPEQGAKANWPYGPNAVCDMAGVAPVFVTTHDEGQLVASQSVCNITINRTRATSAMVNFGFPSQNSLSM